MITARNTQLGVSLVEYRRAAALLWGEAGAFMVDAFGHLNDEYFEDELPALPMVIGLTAYGKCLGATRHRGSWNDLLPRISIASNLFRRGRAVVRDTILHEMVHAKLILAGLSPAHNDAPWCSEISRLSPYVVGRPVKAAPVKTRRIDGRVQRRALDGHLSRPDLARWPHSVRPASWPSGEPIEVETY